MQQTPGFLPIPSAGSTTTGSFPRQTGFAADLGQPGPSRWNESPSSGLSAMMQNNGTPPAGTSSPSSNPHSGFHPGSFGGPLSFSALALGATQTGSSPYASSMAMSISPPRWNPGSLGGGGFSSGSFVGSVGALGTSFGRHAEGRERELEAKYVKDFTCCGRQLSGLHELLEHYEEEHANLAPDVRMAAINAVQFNQGGMATPTAAKRSFSGSMAMNHGDAPITPGMMDMEIDEPSPTPQALLQQASVAAISVNLAPAAASPWSNAFRPTTLQPPACVPPSVLSYAPPAPSQAPAQTPAQRPQQQQQAQQAQQQQQQQPTPQQPQQQQQPAPQQQLTPEQLQAKVLKKAQKKAEREAKENGDGDDGSQPPGEKRFRCPIEGCGKVYKQANGLKYHLTRSINSGHGNVAAMGGLMALLGDGNGEDKD